MKKLILVVLSVLLVWNIVLSIQLNRLSSSNSDGSVVIHNKVDTNDISSVVENVKANIVSVESSRGSYSGVVIEKDGNDLYVVSVSEVKDEINTIVFDSGAKKDATVVGYDTDTDLCVLKCSVDFNVEGFTFENNEVEKGQNVIGIGGRNSSIGNMTISFGVCSDIGSYLMHSDSSYLCSMLETDMNLSERQYGGALVDLGGSLVGIITHHPEESSTHMGYVISSGELENVYQQIKKNSSVKRGVFDVCVRSFENMESYEKNENGYALDTTTGLFVTEVKENSCANGILEYGDRIIKIDGSSMNSEADFKTLQYSSESGQEVDVVFERNGEMNTSKVVLK